MHSCYTGEHAAGDHMHIDITTYNTEEPQQKYRLKSVSKTLLGVGELKNLYFVHCVFTIYLFAIFLLKWQLTSVSLESSAFEIINRKC